MTLRPGFGVVSFVLTVLVLIGIVAQALRPRIPKVPANAMQQERDPFLYAGRLQPIPWQPLRNETFAEALSSDRPILLFVGIVTSESARQIDASLVDPDVARLVTRNFIPVRVDGHESPEWVNALLPVSRLQLRLRPDCQLWLLDPQGRPFHTIRPGPSTAYLFSALRQGADLWKRYRDPTATPPQVQAQDVEILETPPRRPRLALGSHRIAVREELDREFGGFKANGSRLVLPLAYRCLLLEGDADAVDEGLRALLHSPLRDVLDGGFFHAASVEGGWSVTFDKWTLDNAEMAQVLAIASRVFRDDDYRRASRQTLDYLTSLKVNGYLANGEIGAMDGRGRSNRHSFSPAQLRDILPVDRYESATADLGLDPLQNAQGVPYMRQRESDSVEDLLSLLRQGRPRPQLAQSGYADVHLSALARSMAAARILGDRPRLKTLASLLDETRPFFRDADGGVRRNANAETPEVGTLADYLAYADAQLQDYLANGRYVSLEDGFGVMSMVMKTFRTGPGEFASALPTPTIPIRADVPELADNLHEGSTAAAIRLLLNYGRLFGDRPEGRAMRREALTTVLRYQELAATGSSQTAGILRAALECADGRYAVATGPRAVLLADALARRRPTRFIFPALGDVRGDLARRKPGLYVLSDRGQIEGPFGIADAAAKLPLALRSGLAAALETARP